LLLRRFASAFCHRNRQMRSTAIIARANAAIVARRHTARTQARQAPGDSRTDLAEEISDQIGVALGRGEVQRGPLLLLPRIHVGAVRKQHFALHITAANGWRARAAKTGK
jgi:hypothetical protein